MVNSNAKWQVLPDQMLHDIRFPSISALVQLLHLMSRNYAMTTAPAQTVDDFLLCRAAQIVDNVT